MTTCRFMVMGQAQPKGSTRAFVVKGRARITSDNPRLKDWERAVRYMAQREIEQGRWAFARAYDPISVYAEFALPRPVSLPKRHVDHCTKPDVDKLLRGLIDGLNQVAFADDNQVVRAWATKRYASLDEAPHVVVTLTLGSL